MLILQTVGGAVFFAALFVAPLALSIKVLAAVALMFISAAIFILMTNHLASIEGFRVLVDQIARPSEIVESDVLARLGKLQGNVRLQRSGRLVYLLLGMWGFWIFGGFVLRQFLP